LNRWNLFSGLQGSIHLFLFQENAKNTFSVILANRQGLAFRFSNHYASVTDAGGHPKRWAGVGVNVSWRRNKRKAFTFVSPLVRHYFCIISSHETGRAEACVLVAFLCFVSLAGQRNERKKAVLKK
jgi:hypothetical protein